MKILIDLTSLNDNFSGIERFALNIAKEILKEDKENKYILIFKNAIHKNFNEFANNRNIEFVVIKGKNKLIFNQIILPYKLSKMQVDKYIFLAFPSPILLRKKGIINTIHDLTCWDYPKTMKFLSRYYFKISIKNSVNISDNIITVSNFSKKRILNRFNKRNIKVIYNGISEIFNDFNFNEERNKLINEKFKLPQKYIMSLGTLEPRKNLSLLINAFCELKKDNKIDYKLVLVGRKGWKINEVLNKLDPEISKDIIITGFVEDEYLPYIYHNSDFFIFPSIYEGFGIPPLEAMASKVPVISSDIQSSLEILGDSCIYFKNNDKSDLKEKIIYMTKISNEEKIDMIKYGLERSKKFNWRKEAKKLLCEINK